MRSCAFNYRGLQLTSQLSKVVERFIGTHFLSRLSSTTFGDNQFAYRSSHGVRDALLFVILFFVVLVVVRLISLAQFTVPEVASLVICSVPFLILVPLALIALIVLL